MFENAQEVANEVGHGARCFDVTWVGRGPEPTKVWCDDAVIILNDGEMSSLVVRERQCTDRNLKLLYLIFPAGP